MRILLVNPNTSDETTAVLGKLARAAADPQTTIVEATGTFGARLMLTPAEQIIGAHAMLDAAAEYAESCDAIIVGAFGNYGVTAAAQLFRRPVISLADAAFTTLRWMARPFSIVIVDSQLEPTIRASTVEHRIDGLVSSVSGVDHIPGSPDFAAKAAKLVQTLTPTDTAAALLVGPPLLSMQQSLSAISLVPLIDPVACAVRLAEAAARSVGTVTAARAGAIQETSGTITGLSEPLMQALASRQRAGD